LSEDEDEDEDEDDDPPVYSLDADEADEAGNAACDLADELLGP
jgi:hypothetical protein